MLIHIFIFKPCKFHRQTHILSLKQKHVFMRFLVFRNYFYRIEILNTTTIYIPYEE